MGVKRLERYFDYSPPSNAERMGGAIPKMGGAIPTPTAYLRGMDREKFTFIKNNSFFLLSQ